MSCVLLKGCGEMSIGYVRSATEPIDEKKEISQNLLKTPIRSDYFTLEIIEKDRSFNYLK